MTGLGNLFEETVGTPPPSRLRADEVYAAGRHRRRRRMAASASALVVAVATAGVVGATALTAPDAGGDHRDSAAGGAAVAVGSPGDVPLEPGQVIQWSGAGDRDHLYLSYFACLESECMKSKTTVQLLGSDDGGRSWAPRVRAINVVNLAVLGPGTLLATARADAPNRPDQPGQVTGADDAAEAYVLSVSTDGGRTWSAASRPPPVSQVPPGGVVVCWSERDPAAACSPYVFDPATRALARLATPPPLVTAGQVGDVLARRAARPQNRAPLRLAGTDPATGRPTTAASTDGGQTWTRLDLPNLPACPATGCEPPELTTEGGETAYALVEAAGQRRRLVYRSTGTGAWQPVPAAAAVPYDDRGSTRRSYVTADGNLVLCELVSGGRSGDDVDRCRFWSAPKGGGAYRVVELDGLPGTVYPVRRAADGWFYTHSYGDNRLYGSADGRRWSAIPTPDR